MPFPPRPSTSNCSACGWQRTTIHHSDCLGEGVDWFMQCPSCQQGPLQMRPASQTEIMRQRMNDFLRRLRG